MVSYPISYVSIIFQLSLMFDNLVHGAIRLAKGYLSVGKD